MALSTEELMKPRYKVIANYPNCQFKVGEILVKDGNTNDYWNSDETQLYTDRYPEQYPHLFKKLSWWEDRKPEDMPEYVKFTKRYHVAKKNDVVRVNYYQNLNRSFWDVTGQGYNLCNGIIPATKEEFEQYQSQQK